MSEADEGIGKPVQEIDTPALLLDVAAMERNLQRMAAFLAERKINHRPHVKLYKGAPQIARIQAQAGGIGFTCAKLNEAETLAAHGFSEILIANQIVGAPKIERLVRLARKCAVIVAVDSAENAADLSRAASAAGAMIGVLVEVNIGHNRCGVAPFGPALELAKTVLSSPGLRFRGLMGYDGHCTLKAAPEERRGMSIQANTLLADTRKFFEQAGVGVEITSGGGSFTYRYAAEVPGISEVQAGTYLLMDTAFREHGITEFDCALTVLVTVTSRPAYPGAEGLAIIDAGRKSISAAYGNPEVKGYPQAKVTSLSDEHGRVRFEPGAHIPPSGEKLELWVRDANGTINQFDRFYVVRDGVVEDVWVIPNLGNSR